ncbi:MAG: peptidoglycan editing factor PgeF [Candidatus Promineifilaceae bacterium]
MRHSGTPTLPFLHFESLPATGRLRHAVFTRQGGVSPAPFASLNLSASVTDSRPNVAANRERAYASHGRSQASLVHAHLVHGARVARVGRAEYGRHVGPADGLITAESGCGLTMNFADCAPIFLYDPVRGAIGLGHAGWRGALADLPGSLVRAMARAFGSRPAELLAAVGPCIGACCYEVGAEVLEAAAAAFGGLDGLCRPAGVNGRTKGWFDLPAANRRRLLEAGVGQVELAGLCTACNLDLFFSHRAEGGRTGRFGALLTLE